MTQPIGFCSHVPTALHLPCQWVKQTFQVITQFVLQILNKMTNFFLRPCHSVNESTPLPLRHLSQIPSHSSKNILAFYRGYEPNDKGIDLNRLLHAEDQWLESYHLWVQWAFPLEKPSPINPHAPTLDRATIEAMRNDPLIRNNVLLLFTRVLGFYGLQMRADGQIVRGPQFTVRAANWLTVGNHNFLRITRIIHSLGLMLGSPNLHGKSFFDILENIYHNEGKGIIPIETYLFWKNALLIKDVKFF